MTDAGLRAWWPDLATLVEELRRGGHSDVADGLVDAVRAGATGTEILGLVGNALRGQRGLRSRLGDEGKQAWDAVMADVNRPYPLRRLADWVARLVGR